MTESQIRKQFVGRLRGKEKMGEVIHYLLIIAGLLAVGVVASCVFSLMIFLFVLFCKATKVIKKVINESND